MLRKKFKAEYLMQIPAAFVFGYLCDAAIWAVDGIVVNNYLTQIILCIATVVITAIGIRLEIIGNAWMLAGEKTTQVISEVTGIKFSNVKIYFDIFLVAISALFAWIVFGSLTGNGSNVVIREGTVILAFFTGLCMKITDPLVDRIFIRK